MGRSAATVAAACHVTRSVVAATVAALVVAAGAEAAADPPPSVATNAPRTIGFGDAFDYVVEATVPSSAANTAELTAAVDPFTVLDAEPIERERRGELTIIRLAQRLACLDEGCVGRARSQRIALPAPVVVVGSRSLEGRGAAITVRGRIAPSPAPPGPPDPDLFQADTTIPPATSTSPTTVFWALMTAAVVALLTALLLVTGTRRRTVASDDPLARAIRLVRESAGRPEPDRRRAADLLARTALERDRAPLAADARRIAWAPAAPAARTVEDLAASATRETT